MTRTLNILGLLCLLLLGAIGGAGAQTVFVSDTFAGASGTSLSAHAPATGGAWGQHPSYTNNIVLTGNASVQNLGFGKDVYYNNAPPPSADYDVTATFNLLTSISNVYVGVCGRVSSTTNTFYTAQYSSTVGTLELHKLVSGTETTLGSYSLPFSSSSPVVKLSLRGTSLTVFLNGLLVISVNDSSITAAGYAGVLTQEAPAGSETYTTGETLSSFSANTPAPVTGTYPANNSSVFYAPGVTYADNSTNVHITQNGTYFKVGFTGTSFGITLDISAYHLNSITTSTAAGAGWGQWVVVLDGAKPVPIIVPDPGAGVGTITVTFASGLTAGNHTIQAWFDVHDEIDTYTPKDAQVINGFVLDNAASLLVPSGAIAVMPNKMIIMGDSITKGYDAVDITGGGSTSTNYPLSIYASMLGRALNCETGIVGLSGQGYTRTYNTWTQTFPQSFPNFDSTHPRVWPTALNYLVLAEGTNDMGNNVTTATQSLIGTARAAVGATTWIIVAVPFAGMHRADLTAAVTAYKTANPADTKVALVDPSLILSTANSGTFYTVDGTHPPTLIHAQYAAILAGLIQQATAPATGGTKRRIQ